MLVPCCMYLLCVFFFFFGGGELGGVRGVRDRVDKSQNCEEKHNNMTTWVCFSTTDKNVQFIINLGSIQT